MSDTILVGTDGVWVILDVTEPRIRISHKEALQLSEELRQHAERLKASVDNCPWCGSGNIDDLQCNDCGAFSTDYGLIDEDTTLEELQKGWFKGDV